MLLGIFFVGGGYIPLPGSKKSLSYFRNRAHSARNRPLCVVALPWETLISRHWCPFQSYTIVFLNTINNASYRQTSDLLHFRRFACLFPTRSNRRSCRCAAGICALFNAHNSQSPFPSAASAKHLHSSERHWSHPPSHATHSRYG